jgi:hypothetical protein
MIRHASANGSGGSSDDRERTDRLWRSIEATLTGKGIRPGPESYLFWNEGDPAFLLAIWRFVRRLNAAKLLETGVAHGATSRVILEALNGRDHLWSIDLPPVRAPDVHREIGAAVGDRPPDQWSLIFGSSRRRLRTLLRRIAPIDLFIHDSHQGRYNMLFRSKTGQLNSANAGLRSISSTTIAPPGRSEAEPIRPDKRRFNDKGLFGILLKPD